MLFRPCIDLHEGKVKQIVGSTFSDDPSRPPITNFQTELPSSYFARLYKKDGLKGGHVILLGPGNESAAIEALREFAGGLQVGGGITPLNAGRYLDEGASHVIVTSYVFNNGAVQWDRLKELSGTVGKNRLVLDLSCKRLQGEYVIVTDRWQHYTNVALSPDTFARLSEFCGEFLIHAAHMEGLRRGIDEALIEDLARWSALPVTYAGGIRSIDDLERIRIGGDGKVDATVGSALDIFGGSLQYTDVLAWHRLHACSRLRHDSAQFPEDLQK